MVVSFHDMSLQSVRHMGTPVLGPSWGSTDIPPCMLQRSMQTVQGEHGRLDRQTGNSSELWSLSNGREEKVTVCRRAQAMARPGSLQ